MNREVRCVSKSKFSETIQSFPDNVEMICVVFFKDGKNTLYIPDINNFPCNKKLHAVIPKTNKSYLEVRSLYGERLYTFETKCNLLEITNDNGYVFSELYSDTPKTKNNNDEIVSIF